MSYKAVLKCDCQDSRILCIGFTSEIEKLVFLLHAIEVNVSGVLNVSYASDFSRHITLGLRI